MSNTRRGKKLNNNKHYGAKAEFLKHQREGRPKQVWVWEEPMNVPAGEQPTGHWEKVQK